MNLRKLIGPLAALAFFAALGTAAYFTRQHWLPWFSKEKPVVEEEHDEHDHAHGDRIKLSKEAKENLRVNPIEIAPERYWRKITIPGMVVERPGSCDRAITSPVPGVIAEVLAAPGDTVEPDRKLFKLRATGDALLKPQRELSRTVREIAIADRERKRLLAIKDTIQGAELIKVEGQLSLLRGTEEAVRAELGLLGLPKQQIDAAAEGQFTNEVILNAPPHIHEEQSPGLRKLDTDEPSLYEVQELRVHLGDQVTTGQTLALLSNHSILFVEGRGFKQEADLLERAVREQMKVEVEFAEEAKGWPPLDQEFRIRHIANTIDAESRTFGFYLPVHNPSRSYTVDGRKFLVWRFRPGQRARVRIPIEQIVTSKAEPTVFVLPATAVARDGPDAFAFRQSGDVFMRVPVTVLHEEREVVVLANDGSLGPKQVIASSGAVALNRAIKAAAGGGGGGHHHDHDH